MAKKFAKMAIAYDFDGTLAKGNIQENSYIPENLGMTKKDFWAEVKKMAKEDQMDEILAYMYLLVDKARENKAPYNKPVFKQKGKDVRYFNGVELFFKKIDQYAKSKGVDLKHYIISSGTKEMIEGTSIAKFFSYIFASSFKYDPNGVPVWPALAINYTNKTQFLFRINKGIFDICDNTNINKFMAENERPIPFSNIVYIGDGLTDVPAMKLVKSMGGNSIAVYDQDKKGAKKKVEELLDQDRVNYVAAANYGDNSDIYKIIKSIIDQISAKYSIQKFGVSHSARTIKNKAETNDKREAVENTTEDIDNKQNNTKSTDE